MFRLRALLEIRFKYVALAGQGASTVLTASLPGRLLEKCMAGEGLLAQMIVDKYLDHLPIHRQLQRFERMGVRIPQSTSNDWVKNTLSSLHSIYQAHKRITLATSYLSADETPIKCWNKKMEQEYAALQISFRGALKPLKEQP